jgi:hypothetical protein
VRLLVLPLTLAVLALAACGDDSDSEAMAPSLPGAPRQVADRAPLPFCGDEEVMLDGSGIDEDARACFLDAWRDGERAELVSTFRTVEGDPITQVFRSLGAERIQLFIDSSQDRYGGRPGWQVMVCRAFEPDPPTASRCGRPTRL